MSDVLTAQCGTCGAVRPLPDLVIGRVGAEMAWVCAGNRHAATGAADDGDAALLTDAELRELERQDAADAVALALLDDLAHYSADVLAGGSAPACGAPHPSAITDRPEWVTCAACGDVARREAARCER